MFISNIQIATLQLGAINQRIQEHTKRVIGYKVWLVNSGCGWEDLLLSMFFTLISTYEKIWNGPHTVIINVRAKL